MVCKAEGRPGPLDPLNQPATKPNPAYYALVPVVLPFDLVTWPFQYFYLIGKPRYAPQPAPQLAPAPGPNYQPAPAYRPAPASPPAPGYDSPPAYRPMYPRQ